MALLKAKQLNINDITKNVLNTIQNTYDLQFENLVDQVHTFSTGYNFPSLIVNSFISFVNATSATIQWDVGLLAHSYTVYLYPEGDPLNYTIIYGITTNHVVVNNLLPDTIYRYYITPNLSFYY